VSEREVDPKPKPVSKAFLTRVRSISPSRRAHGPASRCIKTGQTATASTQIRKGSAWPDSRATRATHARSAAS